MTVIKWSWHHFVLGAEEFDTFEEAVRAAVYASDAGSESLENIEVAENGESKLFDWGSPEFKAISESIWAEQDSEMRAEFATPRWTVRLRSPNDQKTWVYLESFSDKDAAASAASELQQQFGAKRVRIEAPK